ncbi:metallophosphoesterase [Myxococcota bacterium]|nr:metallophosphoesterase [Myxococcota bacterium]
MSPSPAPASAALPTLAVADLHGHPRHLDALLAWADRSLGRYAVVLLGDYLDNGPDVPGLLDRLAERQGDPGFVAILGNHDLAGLRALDDPAWFDRWTDRYHDRGGSTAAAYGAQDAQGWRQRFPHRALLESLPWVHQAHDHVFVHAGLRPGPLAPQLATLRARTLPPDPSHTPGSLRDRALCRTWDPAWTATVVSAHDRHLPPPALRAPRRLALCAEVDRTGRLHAAVLPAGPLLTVHPHLDVQETA